MRQFASDSPLVSGELQVFRWLRGASESLEFLWTPGQEINPDFDGFVGVEHFQNQPKLGPAVLYERPIEEAYTNSVAQFETNRASGVVRLGSPEAEAAHDRNWFRRPLPDDEQLTALLEKLRAEPPPGTFFDEYWTRAQLEGRVWYTVHGLAKVGGSLQEVIVLCSCPDDPPSVAARAALVQVQESLDYAFEAVEVYRTNDVGPAVSGIGVLRIERRLDRRAP